MKIASIQNYNPVKNRITFGNNTNKTEINQLLDDVRLRSADEFIKSSIIRTSDSSETVKARSEAIKYAFERKDSVNDWSSFQNSLLSGVLAVKTTEQGQLLKKVISHDKCCNDFHTMYKLPQMIKSADTKEKAEIKSDFVDLFFDDGFDNFS